MRIPDVVTSTENDKYFGTEERDRKVVVGQAFIDSGVHEVLIFLNGGESLDEIQVASMLNPSKPVQSILSVCYVIILATRESPNL